MRALKAMRALFDRLRKDAGGHVLLLAGAGTVALVGGAGLGVDTVQWYLWKRQLQQAVDSSALAGGQALSQGRSFTTAATSELNRNRDNNISAGLAVVAMNNPPATGAFAGDTNAVEVIASTTLGLPFSSLFINVSPTIEARAVATIQTDGEFCLFSLAPTGTGINISGTANVALGCGINANSGDLYAIDFDGGGHLSGSPIAAHGGIDYTATNVDAGTQIQSYGPIQNDPLAGLYSMSDIPSSASTCDVNNLTINPSDSLTLSPDPDGYLRLCNGLTVRGNLTLNPGVYIIDRGQFRVNSSASIYGEGVTIILTGSAPGNVATVDMQGGAHVELRAPTAAEDPGFVATDWYGMLMYQDPLANSNNSSKLAGDSTSDYDGIVYMPKADLTLTGSSGMSAQCLKLVTYRIGISGEATIGNSCPADITPVDLGARVVRLVE
jgi:Flp pilus assembly protein TadG